MPLLSLLTVEVEWDDNGRLSFTKMEQELRAAIAAELDDGEGDKQQQRGIGSLEKADAAKSPEETASQSTTKDGKDGSDTKKSDSIPNVELLAQGSVNPYLKYTSKDEKNPYRQYLGLSVIDQDIADAEAFNNLAKAQSILAEGQSELNRRSSTASNGEAMLTKRGSVTAGSTEEMKPALESQVAKSLSTELFRLLREEQLFLDNAYDAMVSLHFIHMHPFVFLLIDLFTALDTELNQS